VLGGESPKVRVIAGGKPCQDHLGELGRLVPGIERQGCLLQSEAVDVAFEDRVRVPDQRDREAGLPKASDHRVVVSQRRRTGRAPRLHEADRPGVALQDPASRDCPSAHCRSPVGGGQVDLAEDQVDHAVEEVDLVGHMVVSRIPQRPSVIGLT
jgi:hypothetical protein